MSKDIGKLTAYPLYPHCKKRKDDKNGKRI